MPESEGPNDNSNGTGWSDKTLRVLLAAAILHAIIILLIGIDQPLLELHAFRQTQTALSAYWIKQGGPWLAYETPVLGAPWAIPFEFPLYQLLAAAVSSLGLSLEVAGRLVSFALYLGLLLPIRIIFKDAGLSSESYLATIILLLFSPLYLYWSRTFMIESCALFFSALWLALFVRTLWSSESGLWVAAGALLVGCLACLTKSTTFPAFALIGGLLAVKEFWSAWRRKIGSRDELKQILVASAVLLLPFVPGVLWVNYSDSMKEANPFGWWLRSASTVNWSFGTIDQRLSQVLWKRIVLGRIFTDTLGLVGFLAIVTLAGSIAKRNPFWTMVLAVLGFLTPILIFTNLHMVHNYYQYANGIFLLAAVGVSLGTIFQRYVPALGFVLLVAIVIGQLVVFYRDFAPAFTRDSPRVPEGIASLVKEHVPPEHSILVFGYTWNSSLTYMSERRSLNVPAWTTDDLLARVLSDPQQFLGEYPLGGIVVCSTFMHLYGAKEAQIDAFASQHSEIGAIKNCRLLAP